MSKNYLFLAMSAALLAACSNDVDLGASTQRAETVDNAIAFQMINRNSITSRGDGEPDNLLNKKGHYNFGVFAYKSNLETGSNFTLSGATEIMNDYLVGYGLQSGDPAGTRGYKLGDAQTTYGTEDGKSKWAYEKLGNGENEYSYTETTGNYYRTDVDADKFYLSNKGNQFLKYWDKSTSQTDFFAYAPYLHNTSAPSAASNGDVTSLAKVQASNNNTTITFPMTEGYDDASKYDFIAAHKTVKNTGENYGSKVQIAFKRLSAMIKIGFYEGVAGYKVKILSLDQEKGIGVSAAPATYDATSPKYSYGKFYKGGTGTGTYDPSGADAQDFTVSVAGDGNNVYKATASGVTGDYLNFKAPVFGEGEYLSEKKTEASYSKTEYYLIPDNGTNKTGLTFHVSYELTAEDTGEKITVYNATVYVPYDNGGTGDGLETYCDWKSNYIYTYIFKITKNSSGQTDKPSKIDPADPKADDDTALKPIIFDGCTVEDMVSAKKEEYDFIINK